MPASLRPEIIAVDKIGDGLCGICVPLRRSLRFLICVCVLWRRISGPTTGGEEKKDKRGSNTDFSLYFHVPSLSGHLRPVQSFFLGLVCFFPLFSCRANGPVFPGMEKGSPVLEAGSFRFSPALFFYNGQTGEIAFEEHGEEKLFRMAVAGRNARDSIRMRVYEGRAAGRSGGIELRSERCYIFGKREWTDRLIPLERWDCDHLVFFLKGNGPDRYVSEASDRTSYSEWYGAFESTRLPFPGFTGVAWSGQIMEKLSDGRSGIWGVGAQDRLRSGMRLRALDEEGKACGDLIADEIVGDFVTAKGVTLCEKPSTAFTMEKKSGQGLF